MKGFPKAIGTGQDLYNCLNLVQAGELAAADLRQSIAGIEARRFLHCPIREISKNRKTVTIGYCAEAAEGESGSGTITKVEHTKAEDSGGAGGMDDDTPANTVVTLAAALPDGETVMLIPAPVDPFASLGITKEQLDAIKEVLAQYE